MYFPIHADCVSRIPVVISGCKDLRFRWSLNCNDITVFESTNRTVRIGMTDTILSVYANDIHNLHQLQSKLFNIIALPNRDISTYQWGELYHNLHTKKIMKVGAKPECTWAWYYHKRRSQLTRLWAFSRSYMASICSPTQRTIKAMW